jgi:hypothetical protein
VCWLDVKATRIDTGPALFGWKSSVNHWNDAASWQLESNWWALHYLPRYGHPFEGQPIDLAFAVESEYGTEVPGGGEPGQVVPERFGLKENVPNPFNPVTTVGYDVPAGGAG